MFSIIYLCYVTCHAQWAWVTYELERIEMDCIWVNWKNVGPPFFQIYVSLYQNNSLNLQKKVTLKTQESQEGTWMDKTREDWNGLHLGKFEKPRPTFFQIYISLHQNDIYTAETK